MWALRSLRRSLPKAAPLSLRGRCAPSISPEAFAAARGGGGGEGEAAPSASAPAGRAGVGGGVLCRRMMSTSKGRSMRSKVEKRMTRETGRTQRELRRAVKLRKKLMTDDERLIHSMRRVSSRAPFPLPSHPLCPFRRRRNAPFLSRWCLRHFYVIHFLLRGLLDVRIL
jgi:hypothetical protein